MNTSSLNHPSPRFLPNCFVFAVAFVAMSANAFAAELATKTIAVDSPAFVFSPGNWVGDAGRGGKVFRQTWNPGAYCRVSWESDAEVQPTLLLDISTHGKPFGAPRLAYCLDGIWSGDVPCVEEIALAGARGSGRHELTVFLKSSQQTHRWGSPGESGRNVLRVKGLRVATDARPVAAKPGGKWALIVGDSITEGVGVYELECYSHLVGEGLRALGYEYGVSACGWSGWLNRGDKPPGDVPGYYVIRNSANGAGGEYLDAESRWNKIDANHSLLDANKHLSANGAAGEEPDIILINYGTNDALWKQNASDVEVSMTRCLPALRRAAPDAHIFVLIPFGQYKAAELRRAVRAFQKAYPDDRKMTLIDLGQDTARALTVKKGYWGGLHPNSRANANFAARVLARMIAAMPAATDH